MTGGGGARLGAALAGAAVVVALLAAFLARSLAPGGGGRDGSALSAEEGGRRALFLLLRRLGHDARARDAAPGALEGGGGDALLLFEPPETPPGLEEDGTDEPRRSRDPRHYRRFLEEGGAVLAPAREELLAFLEELLGVPLGAQELAAPADAEPARNRGRRKRRELAPQRVHFAEDELTLASRRAALPPAFTLPPFRVLAVSEDGQPAAVELAVGEGRLWLYAFDDALDNVRIGREENALWGVRLVERLGAGGTVWFDEYALGGWDPATPLELAFTRGRALALPLVLALVLALWSAAWVGPFPRRGEPRAEVDPAERARTAGALLGRAGRWGLAGRLLQAGIARRLAPRAARETGEPGEAGERGGAAGWLPSEPEVLERWLRPLAVARGGERGWAEAREAFSRTVSDREGLERLARALALQEERLAPGADLRPRARRS